MSLVARPADFRERDPSRLEEWARILPCWLLRHRLGLDNPKRWREEGWMGFEDSDHRPCLRCGLWLSPHSWARHRRLWRPIAFIPLWTRRETGTSAVTFNTSRHNSVFGVGIGWAPLHLEVEFFGRRRIFALPLSVIRRSQHKEAEAAMWGHRLREGQSA